MGCDATQLRYTAAGVFIWCSFWWAVELNLLSWCIQNIVSILEQEQPFPFLAVGLRKHHFILSEKDGEEAEGIPPTIARCLQGDFSKKKKTESSNSADKSLDQKNGTT